LHFHWGAAEFLLFSIGAYLYDVRLAISLYYLDLDFIEGIMTISKIAVLAQLALLQDQAAASYRVIDRAA